MKDRTARFLPFAAALALTTLAVPGTASAQVPTYELVLEDDAPVSAGVIGRFLGDFIAGEDSGWLIKIQVFRPGMSNQDWYFGVYSDSDPLGPRRLPVQPMHPGTQPVHLSGLSMAAGKIAYLSEDLVPLGLNSAWQDDRLIAQVGLPSVGSGDPWFTLTSVQAATDSSVMVYGRARVAGVIRRTAVSYPSETVLIQEGTAVPGTGETIRRIYEVDQSPAGNHVVAIVDLEPSQDKMILLDGAPLALRNGAVAREGTSSQSAGLTNGSTWTNFHEVEVNSAGDVLFLGSADTFTGPRSSFIRNGLNIWSDAEAKRMNEQGFVLFQHFPRTIRETSLEDQPLFDSVADIDMDGDGIADPGFEIARFGSVDGAVVMSGAGAIHALVPLWYPDGTLKYAIVRRDLTPGDNVICQGTPGSSGFPVRLTAVGTSSVGYNQLELLAIGLPRPGTAIGLPLFSTTANASGVQPPGSQGMLCLGGSVGRGLSSLMLGDEFGTSEKRIFLNVLPQPNGLVAALAGETWYAQLWYRDSHQGSATSNFSDAISITFR